MDAYREQVFHLGDDWKIPPFNRRSVILCSDGASPYNSSLIWLAIGIISASEFFCFTMATAIYVILKKNSRNFSEKTYAMHIQLTVLLVAQVGVVLLSRARVILSEGEQMH